jgi:nitronate monooxygenase
MEQAMSFLEHVQVIQGGMGVYVSNWKLAKTVASSRPGFVAGTVSGTGLDIVYARLLQLGNPGGYISQALQALDQMYDTTIGKEIFETYYVAKGKGPKARFKNVPRPTPKPANGSSGFPLPPPGTKATYTLELDEQLIKLLIAAGFAETWLAKQGHHGLIFINFLHKIEIPFMYALYGAMLAGVDGVLVGAGNPDGKPNMCNMLANHEEVYVELNVLYKESGEKFILPFNPKRFDNGRLTAKPLKRPAFLAIVSLEDLAFSLAKSSTMPPDGFVIENYKAGGHNANPVEGIFKRDELGQPVYGEKDIADLEAIKSIGLPFWLGGAFASATKYQEARASGATGIQVGSLFALAEESGLLPEHKTAIFKEFKNAKDDKAMVRTTMYSPTGFSFKVAMLNGTLADKNIYENRQRICDIGLLQQLGLTKPDAQNVRKLFQRCPAAPVNGFLEKRGMERNTEDKRCLCNALLATIGLAQITKDKNGNEMEEPSIVTIGENLQGIREISCNGQTSYSCRNVVDYILGAGKKFA